MQSLDSNPHHQTPITIPSPHQSSSSTAAMDDEFHEYNPSTAAMDDEFHEYNPHPYQGGYDIALTYGSPLPPTPAICYPLSSPPSPPAPPTQPAVEYASPDPPPPSPPAVPPQAVIQYASPDPPPAPSPPAAPELSLAIPEPYACWRAAAAEEEVTSWRDSDGDVAREWRRAANYLFGYSEGYGERWAGTDTYGIPIYANKTYGDGPLVVEVEPAREARLEWHGSYVRELDVVPYSERWDEVERPGEGNWGYGGERSAETDTYGIPIYANKRYGDGPLVVEVEPAREERLEWYRSQDRELDVVPYVNSERWDVVDYTVQEKRVEGNWGYGEVYGERLDPWQNSCSSYEERLDTTGNYGVPEYGYNRHYGEEALTVQIQPHEVAMSLKPGYSEEYTSEEYTTSEANWHSSSNGEPLEAFVPSWEQNPNYYGVYEQDVYPEPQSHFSSNSDQDYDRHHAFGSHSYTYGTHNHEQALSVQLEPFKPSWSQNPLYYGTYRDAVSPKSHQDDEPYHEAAAQIFCPFQKYSDYD